MSIHCNTKVTSEKLLLSNKIACLPKCLSTFNLVKLPN